MKKCAEVIESFVLPQPIQIATMVFASLPKSVNIWNAIYWWKDVPVMC